MQSGITVSKELHSAFNDLVSSPTQRGIIATISDETLVPTQTISSSSTDFFSDLPSLKPHLSTTQAKYIILRRYQNAPDGFVAITYIPDAAPVRQKMLFASTRLSLVRELGTERFRESLSVTELKELGKEGWEKHERSEELKAPLTEDEQTLQGVKEAEAEARGGMAGRKLETGGQLAINLSPEAQEALEVFDSGEDNLLQLSIDVSTETLQLASHSTIPNASSLSSAISDIEPRYTFYKHTHTLSGSEESPIVFIYTCPSGSKIKERMVYASTKQGFIACAEKDFGIEIAKRIEVSSPSEITLATLEEEFRPKLETKQGFSRPKRPGRR